MEKVVDTSKEMPPLQGAGHLYFLPVGGGTRNFFLLPSADFLYKSTPLSRFCTLPKYTPFPHRSLNFGTFLWEND